jgi:hypothetical protein
MPERQCSGCTRQAEWGCDAFKYESTKENKGARKERDGRFYAWHKPAQYPLNVDGEETWACPRQPLKQDPMGWHKLLLFYAYYQKNFLPQQGAVVDQANKAMELFRVLDAANEAADAANEETKRRKAAMNDRAGQDPRRRGR